MNQVSRLFSPDCVTNTIVWRGQTPIHRSALLGDAFALSESIPTSAEIVNCCQDRYNFLVVLVCSLLRGKPAILPNDEKRSALSAISDQYPGALFFADHEIDLPGSALRCAEFTGKQTVRQNENPAIPKEQVATVMFTSGTTGRPVPSARTWQWLVEGAHDYISALGLDTLDGCNIVSTVPSQHAFGLETSAMLPLRSLAAVHAARPLFPKDVFDALSSVPSPTVLVTTPYHLDVLLRSNQKVPAVSLIVSATSPLSKDLAEAAIASFGGKLVDVFGCTEIGLVGTRQPNVSAAWTPSRSLTLRFSNGDSFVTAPHIPGAIKLSDSIAPGHAGTFHLGERSNDVVKIGGRRASLAGLNSILKSIPGVVDAAIICRPHDAPTHHERLLGFVVLSGRNLSEIEQELRSAIPEPFMPRPLLRVSELPRGPTGKILFDGLQSIIGKESSEP